MKHNKSNEDTLELFMQIDYSLQTEETPSKYLNKLINTPAFEQYPFSLLKKLQETKQSPVHHPEGNAWIHTLLVVDMAASIKDNSDNPRNLMWAALLHDIGKPETTKVRKGRITSYDHDKKGYLLTKEFLSVFSDNEEWIETIACLVKYHMHILYVNKNLPFGNVNDMIKDVNIKELSLLGYCDKMGRLNVDSKQIESEIRLFYKKASTL